MSNDNGRQLPTGWAIAAIKDFAYTQTGGTPRRNRPDFYGGPVPWVKSGELGDSTVAETEEHLTSLGLQSSSAKLFPKGTLCIALYGATIGKLGILGLDAATNQAVCGIFLPPSIHAHYLYRALEWKRGELIEQAKGGAQPNISNQIVRDTDVPPAPKPPRPHRDRREAHPTSRQCVPALRSEPVGRPYHGRFDC